MASTFTAIYLHIIFAVKYRRQLITPLMRPRLHSYMAKIMENLQHTVVEIGGVADHVHILIRYNINKSIPETVKLTKVESTNFINNQHLSPYKFSWQEGYACFSIAADEGSVSTVRNYIRTQNVHHTGRTLEEEAKIILERIGIEYDARYLFSD